MGKGGQKVQTSSYEMNTSWGCNVQCGENSIVYLKVAKKVDLKSLRHKKKNLTMRGDGR